MVKTGCITLFIALLLIKSDAQQPDQLLNQWAAQNPIEKLYLHFDRSDYMAGQTIWFKGYLYSDFLPSEKSTSLFVELLNSSSSVISRQILPIFRGFSHGQIDLQDILSEGSYSIRAYTATMLNHDPAFLYKKDFFIFDKNRKTTSIAEVQKPVRIEFFPEGGNLISGLSNTIAFKATNEKGYPVEVSGVVKKENGEQVTEFSSLHDGMGYFDLKDEGKTTYYAVIKDDPSGQKYNLPAPTNKGVVFRIISIDKTKQYEILQRNDDPVFKAAYMIGQMQHHVVFKKEFKESIDEMTGIIQTTNLSSGILQITVFNKAGLPLAERLTFVDNKEYLLAGDITTDTLDFSNRGRNHFTLALKDTIRGSFSVSISDPAFDMQSTRADNILSGLLLTSDLSGYIHCPAYYFSSSADSVRDALDLVMMTNGWRRFKWNDLSKVSLATKKYSDTGYISFSGKINLRDSRKPFADKDVLMYLLSADSSRNMLMIHTDKEGNFSLDSMVFFGRSRVFFSDIKGKKSGAIDAKFNGDSLNRKYLLPPSIVRGRFVNSLSASSEKKMMDDYAAIMRAEGLLLEGVTVKVRKKTALQELEEKYVSALFAKDANSTVDLSNEDLTPYRNIFDYLQERVPGLQVIFGESSARSNPGSIASTGGSGYTILYRQQTAASSMGPLSMQIFLNEIPTDADDIASIPANQVILVKVFGTFVGASSNAPGGVLAIYTKKDADLRSLPPTGTMVSYLGYSVVKEFYSPDYRVDTDNKKADTRVTLYWNPSVLAADINPKIPLIFYNNDLTKQFKIVVEGVTMDGKMLMIEKTVGTKKAF